MFASRAEMEATMPPQKPQQVSPAHKEEVWKGYILGLNIFAATTNSPLYEIADRMAVRVNWQKRRSAAIYCRDVC
jgi:hypothetical protein